MRGALIMLSSEVCCMTHVHEMHSTYPPYLIEYPCPVDDVECADKEAELLRTWQEHHDTGCNIPMHIHELGVFLECPAGRITKDVPQSDRVPHHWTGSGWESDDRPK